MKRYQAQERIDAHTCGRILVGITIVTLLIFRVLILRVRILFGRRGVGSVSLILLFSLRGVSARCIWGGFRLGMQEEPLIILSTSPGHKETTFGGMPIRTILPSGTTSK